MERRTFLKRSALASTALMIPGFLQAQFKPLSQLGKRLIIIQLSGGNDGLNTVVPFRNDIYYRSRPVLGLKRDQLNAVTDAVGFHPAFKNMAKLYESGDLLTINGVGYPNPNRSHFRSMDIWHSASDSDKHLQSGWLGRYLDHQCAGSCGNPLAIEIDGSLSLALKGEEQKALAIRNVKQFNKMSKSRLNQFLLQQHEAEHHHDNHAYLYKTLRETVNAADYLESRLNRMPTHSQFPKTQLGRQLRTMTQMMSAGLDSSVYYTSMSGFDTHVNQKQLQQRLLSQVDEAVGVLVDTLKKENLWKDTAVMIFSEFGRRVVENGSQGTDHGSGNQVFLLSGGLKKQGFYNDLPDLSRLNDGDLAMQIDFRQIYTTLLKDWFNTDPSGIVPGRFEPLNIF
ncbi:DUF1501 domain-containing protein [Gilvibacter sediminis]|uniref:DUF1501 domain-containing protein n=1 Tax=Gilvibacter sediminis TaxID=379071 RepID=UPI0023508D9C|nr:DUF1501 domain-containing protein [Gilvibacter sediminis]MDC7998848.1 DUF1501 domain-containing protein [Gilvibacter sediminis]